MDATLQALGQLLIQALPTVFIVLFLWFYLKATYFGPMERLLGERDAATIGARQQAAESLKRAEAKTAEYEEQLRAARNDLYREQEEQRRKWQAEQTEQILQARAKSDAAVKQAREELAADAAITRENLRSNAKALADEITANLLDGRQHEART